MKPLAVALIALGVALPPAMFAQPSALERLEKSPRHHEWVQIQNGDRKVESFVAYPEVKDKAMVVIVIHENRGLNDWARAVADRLAENGFIAIAPDLLSGAGPNGGGTKEIPAAEVTRAIYALQGPQVIADLNAVADYGKKLPAANGKLAVIGFCWGGGKTWEFAVARHDLAVACPFYGTTPAEAADYAKIPCAVHGFYAGNDDRVDATLDRAKAGMSAAGKTFDLVIYEGAGHAYMRSGEDSNASAANKKAMEESWTRLIGVLKNADKS
jgi:carboxymethylenebutenolidase